MKGKIKFLILAIFLLAFFLRIYKLSFSPPSLYWDEASLGWNAFKILETGKDEYGISHPLTIKSFGDYKPALIIYSIALSIKIFGLNEFSLRFPSVLFGTISTLIIYFLTLFVSKKFMSKEKSEKFSLISEFIFAVSPWSIQFSRGAFEANLGLFLLLLGFVLFCLLNKKLIGLLLSIFVLLVSVYAYHVNKFVAPVIVFIILLSLFKNRRQKILTILILSLFSLVVLFPFFQSLIKGYGLSRLNAVSGRISPTIFLSNFFSYFSFDFLFLHGDQNLRHHLQNFGLLYFFESIFLWIGALSFFSSKENNKKFIFLILLTVVLIPASISNPSPHAIRGLFILPFFAFLVSYGILEISSKLKKSFKIFTILIYFCSIFSFLNNLLVHYPIESAKNWQYGYKQVADFLFKENNYEKYDKIIMTNAYDQPYIYMLLYSNHRFLNLVNDGSFNKGFGKFEFSNINLIKNINNKNTLLIGTEEEIESGNLLKTIYFPNGKVAFKIAKTTL